MKNFQKITEGVDVSGLRLALASQPELWNEYTVRTAHPQSVHRVVDDIILRYNPFDSGDDYVDKVCASVHVVDYPAWYKLPQAYPFIYGLAQRVGCLHLGRVMLTRLAPGIQIPPHSDVIEPAIKAFPLRPRPWDYYNRYHIVVDSAPGVEFTCGDEVVYMAPGEVWWFNNRLVHSVVNNSAEDRVHLIIDIRSAHDNYSPK